MSIHVQVPSTIGFSFLFLTGNTVSPLLIWESVIWETVSSLSEDLVVEGVTKKLLRKIYDQEHHKLTKRKIIATYKTIKLFTMLLQGFLQQQQLLKLSILCHVTLGIYSSDFQLLIKVTEMS